MSIISFHVPKWVGPSLNQIEGSLFKPPSMLQKLEGVVCKTTNSWLKSCWVRGLVYSIIVLSFSSFWELEGEKIPNVLQINCYLIIRIQDCYCFQASLWVIICLCITSWWQVASILQAHSSRRGGPVFVLAKSAAQAWLSPLLDTVCERLVFILRNLYKLAAERILSEECSRGKSLLKYYTSSWRCIPSSHISKGWCII